ncbi:MAG: hypothetical protein RLY14_1851 [Planctomycetota bacterium]|jgi:hypothetical protein
MLLVPLRTRPWQGFPASHNPQRAFVENRHPGVLRKEAPFAVSACPFRDKDHWLTLAGVSS